MSDGDRIDCLQCRHFFVTWDPAFPRGCRAMHFKGKEMPASFVRRISGRWCLKFDKKQQLPFGKPE